MAQRIAQAARLATPISRLANPERPKLDDYILIPEMETRSAAHGTSYRAAFEMTEAVLNPCNDPLRYNRNRIPDSVPEEERFYLPDLIQYMHAHYSEPRIGQTLLQRLREKNCDGIFIGTIIGFGANPPRGRVLSKDEVPVDVYRNARLVLENGVCKVDRGQSVKGVLPPVGYAVSDFYGDMFDPDSGLYLTTRMDRPFAIRNTAEWISETNPGLTEEETMRKAEDNLVFLLHRANFSGESASFVALLDGSKIFTPADGRTNGNRTGLVLYMAANVPVTSDYKCAIRAIRSVA